MFGELVLALLFMPQPDRCFVNVGDNFGVQYGVQYTEVAKCAKELGVSFKAAKGIIFAEIKAAEAKRSTQR